MVRKTKNIQYYEGVGRRKKSVARVRLYLTTKEGVATVGEKKIKAGEIYVNNQPIEKRFPSVAEKERYLYPLRLTGSIDRFAISIIVKGGGRTGQLDAIIHGISRGLELVDKESFRPLLKKKGFLTRDSRKKERRKVGRGGKARKMKQSPKR